MNNIISIAKNTFKETIRDRILYGIFTFALLFLIATIFLGTISLGEDIKVVKDLGLAGIYIFSLIITIFLGSSLIHKELEKKTTYILFSKPVSIFQFVIGKFLGLWTSIILNVLLMTAVFLIIVAAKGGGFDGLATIAVLISLFELAIFVALTVFFSSFTTPLASTLYAIIILYVGHSLDLLKRYAIKSGGFSKILGNIAYYIFPNLEKFNLRNSIVYDIHPNTSQIIYPVLYSVLFVAVFLWGAMAALKSQEL